MSELLDFLTLRAFGAIDRLFSSSGAVEGRSASGQLGVGTRIGERYVIEDLLGEGGFGRVWRVSDESTGRHAALKELRSVVAEGAAAGEALLQMEQEFYSLSKLQHPRIVRVLDYGAYPDGTPYIVMELVPGKDVAQRLQTGPLPRVDAFSVLGGLLQALNLLHARLFVHCDIKSENIRVTSSGDIKLMDFGLLHQLGTPSPQVRGTLAYIAPEMLTGGVIDGRTDLYSTGVLAYEMLTGNLPFDGATAQELMQKHLNEVPKEPSYFLDLPPEVDAFVLKLMAKDPKQRFQSAREALAVLSELAGRAFEAESVTHRTSYLYSADLVGRGAESMRLTAMRTSLLEGKGAAILIAGRGGEGKSRLLEELRLRIKLDKLPWAEGYCRGEGQEPLAAMTQALSSLVPLSSKELLDEHGPVLSMLLPSLGERGYKPPPFANAAQAKSRLHDTVTRWLVALSESAPFALCLEDLQWADAGTLELFNHLIRHLPEHAIATCGTFRSDEVDRTSPVYATVDEGVAELMMLAPLTRDDVGTLLESTLERHTLPAPFVDSLHATTAGNAFFLIESLRYLVEASVLDQATAGWQLTKDDVELPPSIKGVVEGRLAFLEQELLEVCRRVAPLGRALDPKLVARVAGKEGAELFDVLERLVERQYLSRAGRQYLFSHGTVRDAVYGSLDEDVRRSLHLQVAELLERGEATRGKGSAGELAFHYKRSQHPELAVPHFLVAGRDALRKQLPFEATQLLQEGVQLVEAKKHKASAELVPFYDTIATASLAAAPPLNVQAVDKLLGIFTAKEDLEHLRGRLNRRRQRIERLPGFLKQRLLPPPGPPQPFDPATTDPQRIFERSLQLLGMKAMSLSVMGVADGAIKTAERLSSLLPSQKALPNGLSLVAQCVAFFHLGRLEDLWAAAKEAQSIFEAAGERVPPPLRFPMGLSYYFYAMGEAVDGRVLDEAPLARCAELAEKNDLLDLAAVSYVPRLIRISLCGNPEGFRETYVAAEGIARRLGFPRVLDSRIRLWLPVYYLERGELELARATTDKLASIAQLMKDTWLLTYVDIYRGIDAAESGDLERASTLLDGAVSAAREKSLGRVTTAMCALAEVLIKRDQHERARELLSEVLERVTKPPFRCSYDEAVAQRLLGQALGRGEGERHLERAIEVSRALENPIQEAMALYGLAKVRGGDGELLTRAQDIFRRLQNKWWVARIQKERETVAVE